MKKRITAGRAAAMAVLDAMEDLFVPLTEAEKVDAMEELVDELASKIRCADEADAATSAESKSRRGKGK